jgi:hypothetical protein
MIAALHLDDPIACGGGASQTNCVHGAFRAAIAEAHHLDRKALADFFGQLPFQVVWHSEHRAGAELRLHGFNDRGVAVAGHQSAETQIEIYVFVAINVVNVSPFSIADENWVGIVSAVVAGNA